MILVDTSVWINLLAGRLTASETELANFAVCGPVVQEVLQGLRPGPRSDGFTSDFLELPCLGDPLPRSTFVEAARIYRLGRKSGRTIRSATDCLIASIAIDNDVPVWHSDRDFRRIAEFTELLEWEPARSVE